MDLQPTSPGESSKRPRSPSPTPAGPASKKVAVEDEEAQVNLPPAPTGADKATSGRGGRNRHLKSWQKKGNGESFQESFNAAKVEAKAETKGDDGDGEGAGEDGDVGEDGKKRLPKKRVAILLGYCGTGYSGMQIQPGEHKTIEGEFFAALVKAGAVSADNSNDHRKVDVARAARTDAGVHAAGNCISMKMILAPPLPPEHETLASYVNTFLPEQIRMWGFVRTVKSFAARTACDSRKYEYLLPSYCLLPPPSDTNLSKAMDASSPGWRAALGDPAQFADGGIPSVEEITDGKLDPKTRGEYERRRAWRIDPDTLDRFRKLIEKYKGTHNFHNYTIGKPFNDRSVKRFMMSLEVRDPQVVGEIEWISVQIHGQSFMLHQIRKMISMAMLACRTGTPPSLIPETYGPKRIHIPKAPPLGLLLEAPQFGMYNKRVLGQTQGERDTIEWEAYAEEIKAFKLKYIYEKLRQDELQSNIFQKWIKQMDNSDSAILAFLNTKGIIPPQAEVSKNKERQRALEKEEASEDEELDQDQLKRGELEG